MGPSHKAVVAGGDILPVSPALLSDDERVKAAELIQRNYRGYRTRRQLNGLGIDASTRWTEAIREMQYRNVTNPQPRYAWKTASAGPSSVAPEMARTDTLSQPPKPSTAVQNWKKAGQIVRRAGEDEASIDSTEDEDMPEEQREEMRRLRAERRAVSQKSAKMMDLPYFLELVDHHHRYGSHLRAYHEVWKKADTKENFFYWLDFGDGRSVNTEKCSREVLDRDQVRYLSREERLHYLVQFDDEGRFCWAKNGARIETTNGYKDSIKGIVPLNDPTPGYPSHYTNSHTQEKRNEFGIDRRSTSPEIATTEDQAEIKHTVGGINPSQGTDSMVGESTTYPQPSNSGHSTPLSPEEKKQRKKIWIFVADTSFRIYIGMKQSGAFQHSSFLHGSRIVAAGQIKLKDGRVERLDPLSGHYRPPVSSFRTFVRSLKAAHVDLSHVSLSRSYAVLLSVQGYKQTKAQAKELVKNMAHEKDKILAPEVATKREEEEKDKSQSAAKELKWMEMKRREQRQNRIDEKLKRKLRLLPKAVTDEEDTLDSVGEEHRI